MLFLDAEKNCWCVWFIKLNTQLGMEKTCSIGKWEKIVIVFAISHSPCPFIDGFNVRSKFANGLQVALGESNSDKPKGIDLSKGTLLLPKY